jgi:hypothetical protein
MPVENASETKGVFNQKPSLTAVSQYSAIDFYLIR